MLLNFSGITFRIFERFRKSAVHLRIHLFISIRLPQNIIGLRIFGEFFNGCFTHFDGFVKSGLIAIHLCGCDFCLPAMHKKADAFRNDDV